MNKISFFPSTFTAEETNSMGQQMLLSIASSGSTDDKLALVRKALTGSNDHLTSVLNAEKSNPYSELLKSKNSRRQEIFWGGRDVLEGITHWIFDVPKKEAAERLVAILKRHGWTLNNYNYQNLSAALNSLNKELKESKNQEDLATTGMMDWFNALVTSQSDFEVAFNQKTSEQNKKESLEKHLAQIPVNEDIEKLVIYLNSIILFNETDEIWNNLYNSIEGIVKQFTTISRTRRSGGNNKADTE